MDQKASAKVLVLDFGAQYGQLIARRVRDLNVYSEIVPCDISADEIREMNASALILSGGPASVYAEDAPSIDPAIFDLGLPVLGFCYGHQITAVTLGGKVGHSEVGEYGRATITRTAGAKLFNSTPMEQTVWMSHRDAVSEVPEGFTVTASTDVCPVAAMECVVSKGAKEPPGGAGNAGNSSSSGATQNRRQEPPGSAERQSSGSKHAGQESAESTKAAEAASQGNAASQEHTASSGQEPNAASGTSAGDTQSAGNPASEGTEHGVSSTEIPGGASTAEKVAGGEMPYGTAQEGKSDNQSKKQATPQQAGAGQEPPGKAGSQPEKTATGQANNKQQQKSGDGSSSEPRKTTEKSGQAKAADSTKQEPPGKAAAAGKSGEKSAAGTAGEQTQAQPSQDALPSNTDEGQEAMESQEPPTNWGGAGETDNNSVPFSSGENEMPERGMSGNEPTAQDFPASSDQSEPDSASERVRNGHTGTPIGEKTKSTQAVRNVSGQDSQSKSSAGTKQTTTQRTTTQKSEHVQNGHSNTKSATSPVRPEPPGNARKM